MVIEILLMVVTIIALLVASYHDIKTREVPDWLSYGLIFAAFGLRFIYALEGEWNIFWSGLLGFGLCFGLACLFYYTDQWGGGDSKLLMGIGAVLGLPFPFSINQLDLLWFFMAMLLLGAGYGLLWMAFIALSRREQFIPACAQTLRASTVTHLMMWALAIIFAIFSFWYPLLWAMVLFLIALFYLYIFITSVEKSCFFRKIGVEKLTEGDWLAEDVMIKGKMVLEKKTLEEKDLKALYSLKRQGKLKEVLVKEGIPFVPSFLLAYLLIILSSNFQNWFLRIFGM